MLQNKLRCFLLVVAVELKPELGRHGSRNAAQMRFHASSDRTFGPQLKLPICSVALSFINDTTSTQRPTRGALGAGSNSASSSPAVALAWDVCVNPKQCMKHWCGHKPSVLRTSKQKCSMKTTTASQPKMDAAIKWLFWSTYVVTMHTPTNRKMSQTKYIKYWKKEKAIFIPALWRRKVKL